jgi:hypothetical protein
MENAQADDVELNWTLSRNPILPPRRPQAIPPPRRSPALKANWP